MSGDLPVPLKRISDNVIYAPEPYWRAQIKLAQALEDFIMTPSGAAHCPQTVKDALKTLKDSHYGR